MILILYLIYQLMVLVEQVFIQDRIPKTDTRSFSSLINFDYFELRNQNKYLHINLKFIYGKSEPKKISRMIKN